MRWWLLLTLAACAPDGDAPPRTTTGAQWAALADVQAFVGEPVAFDAGEGLDGVRWSLGDGTTAEGPTVEHTYGAGGHYPVSVSATVDGEAAVRSFSVSVVARPLATPPSTSGTLARYGDRLAVAAPGLGRVVVLDTSGAVVGHVAPCEDPRAVAWSAQGLAVSCERDAQVVVYDDALNEQGRADTVGWLPHGLLWAEGSLWVLGRHVEGMGAWAQLDGQARVVAQGDLGADLRHGAWLHDTLLAPSFRSAPSGGQVHRLAQAAMPPWTVAVAPGPDSDVSSRGVPNLLGAVAVRPDGENIALGGVRSNIERGLVRDGQTPDHETTVRAELRVLDGQGVEVASPRLDNMDRLSALAYDARGEWLFGVVPGAGKLIQVDAYDHTFVDAFPLPLAGADGVVVHDGVAWVHLRYHRSVLRIQLATGHATEHVYGQPEWETLSPEALMGALVFHGAGDPRMSRDGYVSCASCHPDGEHDGQTWDFTHRGEGLRNTTTLLGLADRAGGPLHWSGNFDEVQDFEHDIRGPQGGRGFLDDGQFAATQDPLGEPKAGRSAPLDALAAYVNQLEALPSPQGRKGPDLLRGEGLFFSRALACGGCHQTGGSGWSSEGEPVLFDVGTLTSLSGGRLGGVLPGVVAPDLRGVWATAPYLHDGSVASLDALLRLDLPAHGGTGSLDDGSVADLVVYLQSL